MRRLNELGCGVGKMDVDQLFCWYANVGFLYPEKCQLLKPYMSVIRENWRRALSAPHELMFVVSRTNGDHGASSLTSWRSTARGWVTQHLISQNDPLGSMAVILGTSSERSSNHEDDSHQLWFRPQNKFPNRLFGKMVAAVGEENSCMSTYTYCTYATGCGGSEKGAMSFSTERISTFSGAAYIRQWRGRAFAIAEQFDTHDVDLRTTNELYRECGLFRRREVYIVFKTKTSQAVGYCASYRGPLGLNFSFLENRAEIFVDAAVPMEEAEEIISVCLNRLRSCYRTDYEPSWFPVTITLPHGSGLRLEGLQACRVYSQGIWTRDGFSRFHKHVEDSFANVKKKLQVERGAA